MITRNVLLTSLVALAPLAWGGPLEIAHRGASGYLPEHTLEATALAHGLGADYIEQDVVMTRDGIAVVLHDIHLDGVTDVAERFPGRARPDGKHYAIDFDLAELKTLVLRERFDPATGRPVNPGRYAGILPHFRIATFAECLALVTGLNASTGRQAGVYVEIKRPAWHREQGQDPSAAVLAALAVHGLREKTDPCFLQCFELTEVRRLRGELGYRGRLVLLLGGDKPGADGTDYARIRTPEGLREMAVLGVDGIGPALDQLVEGSDPATRKIRPLAADARAAGLEVHPYTARVDGLPKWASDYADLVGLLGEIGVEAFFTDFPGALR